MKSFGNILFFVFYAGMALAISAIVGFSIGTAGVVGILLVIVIIVLVNIAIKLGEIIDILKRLSQESLTEEVEKQGEIKERTG